MGKSQWASKLTQLLTHISLHPPWDRGIKARQNKQKKYTNKIVLLMEDKWKKRVATKTKQVMQTSRSPPLMGRLMHSQYLSKRWLTFVRHLLFPFIAEHDIMLRNISSDHLPSCVPCQFIAHSSLHNLFICGADWETEKALMKTLSAKARTLVCCQYWTGQNSKTQHHVSCYEEN